MKPLVHIGAEKETVVEAKKAILEILNTLHNDQLTKQIAIKALSDVCSVSSVFTNCTFLSDQKLSKKT